MIQKVVLALFLLFVSMACRLRTVEAQHSEGWLLPPVTQTTTACRPASDSLNPFVDSWVRLPAVSQPLFRGNTNRPLIALTFDVEGTPSILNQLLNVLDRHGVKTTIFVLGSWAEQYPDSVAAIARRGHEFGNHTYSHSNIRELSAAQLQAELERTEEIILNLTGQTTKPWMRPPYGLYSQENVQAAYEAGWTSVIWTATAEDTLPVVTEESICNALVRYAVPGAILLAHPSRPVVPAAVDRFITEMHARGYAFVPLSAITP
jgi:peptidoglycan-N-acetylglucosamine deacetylase